MPAVHGINIQNKTGRKKELTSVKTGESKTMTVPQAGATYFGLSESASYRAERNGELPTIRIGRLLRVPTQALEKMLADAKPKSVA
jgi:excisionase family DNA binding protein